MKPIIRTFLQRHIIYLWHLSTFSPKYVITVMHPDISLQRDFFVIIIIIVIYY